MQTDYSPILILITAFVFLTLMGVIGAQEQQERRAADSDYCQMVTIWKQDEAAGVKPVNRNGWPDFRDNYHLTCTGYAGREQ
jgi:hypothetical protein